MDSSAADASSGAIAVARRELRELMAVSALALEAAQPMGCFGEHTRPLACLWVKLQAGACKEAEVLVAGNVVSEVHGYQEHCLAKCQACLHVARRWIHGCRMMEMLADA